MSQTQKVLELGGRKITLVGTAHVSAQSIEEVTNTIKELKPDCVAVELDEKRADSIQNGQKYSELDIIKVIREGKVFLVLANLMLASFQKRMGQNIGVKPGDEMLAAIKTADEMGIATSMVDRPVQVTLRRAWAKNGFFGKMGLLASLLASAFSKEEVDESEIEALKQKNEMDSMMGELSKEMPVIKEVLIDERDKYLASKIWESQGNNIVAVLGAGHLAGVEAHLNQIAAGSENSDVSAISEVPAKKSIAKFIGWLIPAIIIGFIAAGFVYGGRKAGTAMLSTWVLWNGIPSAALSILALAHPVTIIVSFIAAPFTSLCPFIGVGFVSGIIQAMVCKPRVRDMENLSEDVQSIKGFYRNRILRVLLVFILSSVGSSIGTFAGGADVIRQFSEAV
ncbi:TraB/GumN family protein [Treponema sp. C6A8]|uniref:TraB/GumN family protein n=1 Tax=Treponema sp. C6A8 TaxID=1410609 RepID=UPI00048285DF|nr:TraB/GumN family protein [Treponema sp. C6A8]